MANAAEAPVLVIGPGAIGCLVAARLANNGVPVVVAARTQASARLLESSGIHATDPDGAVVVARVPVIAQPGDLHAIPRFVVLATKCQAAVPALTTWMPALGEAPVVALQNGDMGDELALILGDRLMECTVALPATLHSPGHTEQTGPGLFFLGPWPLPRPGQDPAPYRAVAEVLAAVAPVRASANMRGVKWTKLLINSCITSLGGATGESLGELLTHAKARRAFTAIVEEGYAVGKAAGVRFEPVQGFWPGLFGRRIPGRRVLLAVVARKYRRQRSSSLQSLERGKVTEVNFLNGRIAAEGRVRGIATPMNDALVALIHRIESGTTTSSVDRLDDLPV